jgi:hypothetical protein
MNDMDWMENRTGKTEKGMKTAKSIFWAAAAGVLLAGCGPYVYSGAYNPVSRGAYTRAETIPAGQRLVDAMLADGIFAQHYAAKAQQRGGAPVVQVAHITNLTPKHNGSLALLRSDLEEALRASGRFVLSGDPDACDYILKGEYREVQDGRRGTHRVTMRLHDIAANIDVWSGSDEIAKEK